jgi:hypothetical protein
MATKDAPLTLTEVIEHVERIREELLTVQRALEKMERAQIGGPHTYALGCGPG